MDTFRERLSLRTYHESLNTSTCDNEMLDEGNFISFLHRYQSIKLINQFLFFSYSQKS